VPPPSRLQYRRNAAGEEAQRAEAAHVVAAHPTARTARRRRRSKEAGPMSAGRARRSRRRHHAGERILMHRLLHHDPAGCWTWRVRGAQVPARREHRRCACRSIPPPNRATVPTACSALSCCGTPAAATTSWSAGTVGVYSCLYSVARASADPQGVSIHRRAGQANARYYPSVCRYSGIGPPIRAGPFSTRAVCCRPRGNTTRAAHRSLSHELGSCMRGHSALGSCPN